MNRRRQGAPWPRRNRRKRFGIAALICFVLAGAFVWLGDTAFFQTIEGTTLGWRFHLRGPSTPGGDVVVLAIDDKTLAAHGPWPLSRRVLAETIRRLDAAGASVIALDLLLINAPSDRSNAPDGTEALIDAMRATGKVVVPFAFLFDPRVPGTYADAEPIARGAYRIYRVPAVQRPTLPLNPTAFLAPVREILDAGHPAHVNAVLGPDGTPRFFNPVIGFGGAFFPALPIEAVRLHLGLGKSDVAIEFGERLRLGSRRLTTDHQMRIPVNFYGPEGSIETRSLSDFLNGNVPVSALAGRIVLIGATASGVGDRYPSPFTQTLPGVEYFATVTDNLIAGRFITRSAQTAALTLVAIVGGGLLAGALWYVRAPKLAIAAAVALVAAWPAVAYWSFAQADMWLNVTFPTLAIVLNLAVVAAGRAVAEHDLRREAESERSTLARFVSPVATAELGRGAATDTGQRRQPAAVLFVDLRGFTTINEAMGDAAVLPLLEDFHRLVQSAIAAHHGTLDKFMGDGALAIFGLSEPALTDPADALACAHRLVAEIEQWNAAREADGESPIAIGVGVHYGPVMIGPVGGEDSAEMVVSGDTVNVASRLEQMTKTYGARIVASDALASAVHNVGRDDLMAGSERLAAQEIRGRRGHVDVWIWRVVEAASGAA